MSHSSTEAEFVALDAALRMEGLSSLQFWELVVSVFSQGESSKGCHGHLTAPGDRLRMKQKDQGGLMHGSYAQDPFNVDFVPPSFPYSKGNCRLYLFEDNEPVIKMSIKGRAPQFRQMPRTHRIN